MAMKQQMHGSELIISKKGVLYHINLSREKGFPPRFIVTGDPKRVKGMAKFFDNDGKIYGRIAHREYVSVWGEYKGMPIAIMGTGIGTDNIEIGSVEWHAVREFEYRNGIWQPPSGDEIMVRLGTSGSPQRKIRLGTLAIGEHAIGLDNTGLFYLHKPFGEYVDLREILYTPGNEVAKAILDQIETGLSRYLQIIQPYVSTATPTVVQALIQASEAIGAPYETGIITSASGFFGPQGRQVGRASNILVPNLQEILATIQVEAEDGRTIRTVANEMESSTLFRIVGEILGYKTGTVCSVIANRAEGEFIGKEEYAKSMENGTRVSLEAVYLLATSGVK
jgi:uridine phosphorylase